MQLAASPRAVAGGKERTDENYKDVGGTDISSKEGW